MAEEKPEKKEEKKAKSVIIVKGVEEDIKESLKEVAEISGKAISDVVREALRLYVAAREIGSKTVETITSTTKELIAANVTVIKNIGELSLNKEDLLAFKEKVSFMNINKLEFAEDVTEDVFQEKVDKIVNVKELIVSKNLPKHVLLPKCNYVDKITIKPLG